MSGILCGNDDWLIDNCMPMPCMCWESGVLKDCLTNLKESYIVACAKFVLPSLQLYLIIVSFAENYASCATVLLLYRYH